MSTLLMIVAVFCLAISTLLLMGEGELLWGPMAWLAAGLTAWALAVLIGGAAPIIERIRQ